MKNAVPTIIVIAAIIIGVVIAQPFYVVDEGEQAVIVQMGRIVRVVQNAGLHIKVPAIDQVVRYPRRILAWDGDAKSMPTREKQYIWVDVTARWRISDPQKFYESITTVNSAYSKLGEIIDSEIRTIVADNNLRESVRNTNLLLDQELTPELLGLGEEIPAEQVSTIILQDQSSRESIAKGRRQLAEEVLARSRRMVPEYGIELIDVVTRQIRYSDELTQSVYARMIKERNQIAQGYRSEGEGKKAEWFGKTDNEQRSILSEAYAKAEKTRGDADAEATRIYAEAYNRDRSFFEFFRALESYKATLPTMDKTLSTDMDYFRYLYSPLGR
jgi:membrane protease subunit HflC